MRVTQVLSIVLLLLTSTSCGRPPFCPSNVNLSLGELSSMDAGDRASIQKLSEKIHSCPKATEYYISWKTPPNPEDRGWRALVYRRENGSSGWFGHEYDPGSGTGSLYLVSDEAVHKVAQKRGTTQDFAKYQICEM